MVDCTDGYLEPYNVGLSSDCQIATSFEISPFRASDEFSVSAEGALWHILHTVGIWVCFN